MVNFSFADPFLDFDCIFLSGEFLIVGPDKIYAHTNVRYTCIHAAHTAGPQRRMAASESRTSTVAAAAAPAGHRLRQLHETLTAGAAGAAAGVRAQHRVPFWSGMSGKYFLPKSIE